MTSREWTPLYATYLLAAGRVYLPRRSLAGTVGSYPTRFTITPTVSVEVVSFLWHFPWDYPGCR